MISFNLTALTQLTLSIQRKSKPAIFSPGKPLKILPNLHSYFQHSFYSVASIHEYLQEIRLYIILKRKRWLAPTHNSPLMRTRKWRQNPFTCLVMRAKTNHPPHHHFFTYQTIRQIKTVPSLNS